MRHNMTRKFNAYLFYCENNISSRQPSIPKSGENKTLADCVPTKNNSGIQTNISIG